jgi:hypothetical protein
VRPRRFVAIGDPQAPTTHVEAVLRRAGDAGVVVVGDYFDFPSDDPRAAGREGVRTLRALATRPAESAILLLGNHDACRVMELSAMTDTRFASARSAAASDVAAFAREFPELPTPDLAARDFATFVEEQRALVQELLSHRRLRLAAVGALDGGREVLVTHAAVTTRELALLGMADETRAEPIARALNAFLDRAVERVAGAWSRGERAALDLEPLHVAGTGGQEGGGLLYHRPANPDRDGRRHGVDVAWETDRARPRRFHPRALPPGLVQACGHTTHKKSWKELAGFRAPGTSKADVGIRTLLVRASGEVEYDTAPAAPAAIPGDAAALLMIDAGMRDLPADAVPLLELFAARAS